MQLQVLTFPRLSTEYFKALCFLYILCSNSDLIWSSKAQEVVDTATCFSLVAAGVLAARQLVAPTCLIPQ